MRNHHIPRKLECGVLFALITVKPEVYLTIFNASANQLTDEDPTTGYFEPDKARCHTPNASKMRQDVICQMVAR
jgi:hypothetical protein